MYVFNWEDHLKISLFNNFSNVLNEWYVSVVYLFFKNDTFLQKCRKL